MRIDTTTCDDCGTVIAVNVLLTERMLNCPGLGCEAIHRLTSFHRRSSHTTRRIARATGWTRGPTGSRLENRPQVCLEGRQFPIQ